MKQIHKSIYEGVELREDGSKRKVTGTLYAKNDGYYLKEALHINGEFKKHRLTKIIDDSLKVLER